MYSKKWRANCGDLAKIFKKNTVETRILMVRIKILVKNASVSYRKIQTHRFDCLVLGSKVFVGQRCAKRPKKIIVY